MRTCLYCTVIVAALAATQSSPATAQVPATAPPAAKGSLSAGALASRYGIAVVDISYIFKNHQRFNAAMEQMKTDVQATEGSLKQEAHKIAQIEEELAAFVKGSPDFKRREEELVQVKSDFNVKAAKQRRDFLEREASIYYKAYLEVNDVIKYHAQRNNIGLVLRFNGDPIDPNQREDVLRAINKPVVYQNGIDITPDILGELNRGAAAPTPRVSNGGSPGIPGRPNPAIPR